MSRRGKINSKKSNNIGLNILLAILIILVIGAASLLAIKIIDEKGKDIPVSEITEEPIVEEKEIQIYKGTDRPIAVMIDNHEDAWPQANLNKAYIVYEIIVEGGETRLMALYKGQDLDKIGPIRSSRHYFLDYAMENDAIYVHYGWSPQAESDIKTYKVNNINGLVQSEKDFWRVKDKYAPHNAVSNTKNILKIAEKNNYRTTSSAESVLNYVADEVLLEDGNSATKITIPFSTLQTVAYEYNQETKMYERYARKEIQKDWVTGETVAAKNIIITFAENYTLSDAENKGRQGLKNIGVKEGYYITNGKSIKITCEKLSRTDETIYKDLDGNEINVNDGNTFIEICPLDAKVVIEGVPEVTAAPITNTTVE
ncbi:MAG: DUF3048 domain-containing protein [Clostridia bacterium]|nr:DUF3048 domain-containing protein [Clostridia bacterium]